MNVAAITITYNDDYKFTEWLGHYQEYKDELYLHIVVDNHSCEEIVFKEINRAIDGLPFPAMKTTKRLIMKTEPRKSG